MGDGIEVVGGYKRRDHTSSETPGVMQTMTVDVSVSQEEGKVSKIRLNSYLQKWLENAATGPCAGSNCWGESMKLT